MKISVRKRFPRIPLDGRLDLTFRCNNNCRHCWLWLPCDSTKQCEELSFQEIRNIVDKAREMGCQSWSISGGEPMLRSDFPEIFDYITRKAIHYRINTNGTLITPKIAHLLARKGYKMIALYGATADVHDHVTRTPGSFDATMRGFAYMKEAGANFTVQIVPMRDNFHQYDQMMDIAQSLSDDIRVGAPWLWLSADHNVKRNQEIIRQRLAPSEVIALDEPDPVPDPSETLDLNTEDQENFLCGKHEFDNRLFASCIASRRDFHIDPYGQMSFCYYVKDPELRYNLRNGSFTEAWEDFIPSLSDKICGGPEYWENCQQCELREECRWCPVFGYLEHGRYSAKVDYLCQVAKETKRYKENWRLTHLRYYQIAGITLQVTADFPLTDQTFEDKFKEFRIDFPGTDVIIINLRSGVPALTDLRLGKEIYQKPPWAIYQQNNSYVYREIFSDNDLNDPNTLAIVSRDHNKMTIYRTSYPLNEMRFNSLTTLVTDQILLSVPLSYRDAFYIHSSAAIINGKGLLFVGHSEAGKSTISKMIKGFGEILCDDRNIIRKWKQGFKVHGTWSHGELPDVSPAGAPLQAILFLEQSPTNELIQITDKRVIIGKLLSHVVRSLVTQEWWDKVLVLAGKIANEVPVYRLKFDKSGQIVDILKNLSE